MLLEEEEEGRSEEINDEGRRNEVEMGPLGQGVVMMVYGVGSG